MLLKGGFSILFCEKSWFVEVFDDEFHLMFGIELAVLAHPASVHLLAERLAAAYPTPQSSQCSMWLQVGEVEHCKLLFAVTSYFHFFKN